MTEPLTARSGRLKRLARLARSATERRQQGRYIVEGPTLVLDALAARAGVEAVYAEPGAAPEVEAAAVAAGVELVPVGPGALERVADVVTARPVVAELARRAPDLGVLTSADLVLVLAGVGDPGNVGTLIRTAEAAGVGAVACVEGTADPTSPKVVRASAGSVFRIPVLDGRTTAEVLVAVRAAGMATVGTVVDGGEPYDRADWTGPVAIVLGSEPHGLASDLAATLDRLVTIPMSGRTESLNVAMAGTLLAFEAARSRRGGRP